MASFGQLKLTELGVQAQLKAQNGTPLKFTKIAMGSGVFSGDVSTLTGLVKEEVLVGITKAYVENDVYTVLGSFSNEKLETTFVWREIGLYFEDENGNNVLYCYANAGSRYDDIPVATDERYTKTIRIATAISNAANVSIVVGDSTDCVPVNNNLIINSNFANPVNQRGKTSMQEGERGYWIDRWTKGTNISCSIVEDSGYIAISRGSASSDISLYHYFEDNLLGKTVTFSVKLYGGDILTATAEIPSDYSDIENSRLIQNVVGDHVSINIGLNYKGIVYVGIAPHALSVTRVEWAKLEIGGQATPYVPRLYAEEFQLCQRYYQTSPLRDSVLYNKSANDLSFHHRVPVKMRANPNVSLVGAGIQSDGSSPSGFEFTVNNATATNTFTFKAAKTSHGLTSDNCITAVGVAYLDAEL